MRHRIVLLGASGYTGRLVAAALMRARVRPVLAGRSAQNLAALGVELGHGLDTAVADVTMPDSVMELIQPGDVVINTVGPFTTHGRAVVEAAIRRRATYIDSCDEPQFLRVAFEELGDVALQAEAAVIPGFGHRFVAGTLAAALAIERTGRVATAVDVGYFATGPRRASTGVRAARPFTVLGANLAWRHGELVAASFGDRVRSFPVDGVARPAMAVGGSEHITLPRTYPRLRDIGVYSGGARWTRGARLRGTAARRGAQLPGVDAAAQWFARRPRTMPGPDELTRARGRSVVVAVARDAEGRDLHQVALTGPSAYTLTAEVLAWAALTASADGVSRAGALGPLEAFDPSSLRAACTAAGLVEATTAPAGAESAATLPHSREPLLPAASPERQR